MRVPQKLSEKYVLGDGTLSNVARSYKDWISLERLQDASRLSRTTEKDYADSAAGSAFRGLEEAGYYIRDAEVVIRYFPEFIQGGYLSQRLPIIIAPVRAIFLNGTRVPLTDWTNDSVYSSSFSYLNNGFIDLRFQVGVPIVEAEEPIVDSRAFIALSMLFSQLFHSRSSETEGVMHMADAYRTMLGQLIP